MRKTRVLEIKMMMDDEGYQTQHQEEASIDQSKALTVISQPEEETIVIDAKPVFASKRISVCFTLIILFSSIIITSLIILVIIPLCNPIATVIIVPKSKEIHTTITLTSEQVHARSLSAMILSQGQTVPATGEGHQEAMPAQGTLTFYNALPEVQTIPAGTVLTSREGVQVVTDETAVIPAGSLNENGSIIVSAHTMNTGASLNLPAGAIEGACCRPYILVASSAFTGGQSARNFTAVSQMDIDYVVKTLMPQLEGSITNAYRSQIRQDEALVTPLSCRPQITSDHTVGMEASQVTVTVNLACNAYAYHALDFQHQAREQFHTAIAGKLGRKYVAQSMNMAITKTEVVNGDIQLTVSVHGAVIYQLNQDEKTRLIHIIAGKNKQNALHIILHTAGIASASIEAATLPANPDHIHLVVARS